MKTPAPVSKQTRQAAQVAAKTALAVNKSQGLAPVAQNFRAALESLSNALTRVTPAELPAARGVVKQLQDVSKHLYEHIKDQIVDYVREHGKEIANSKGGLEAYIPGVLEPLKVGLHRTGVDPRKLEALLRAKELKVELCMVPKISFAVDDEKVAAAVEAGKLTEAEVATCFYDETWVLR